MKDIFRRKSMFFGLAVVPRLKDRVAWGNEHCVTTLGPIITWCPSPVTGFGFSSTLVMLLLFYAFLDLESTGNILINPWDFFKKITFEPISGKPTSWQAPLATRIFDNLSGYGVACGGAKESLIPVNWNTHTQPLHVLLNFLSIVIIISTSFNMKLELRIIIQIKVLLNKSVRNHPFHPPNKLIRM